MTTLSNGAPITIDSKLLVTTTAPTAAWPFLGGFAYDPVTMALAVKDAVPTAVDSWNNGIRTSTIGQMYVTSTLPSPLFYVHGLPVSADGRVLASSGAGVGWAPGGWPIGPDGGISMDGLAAQPIFWAPLLTTLVPTTAGNPAFTFTRATTAYVADNEGILRQSIQNEARFQGARRVRNWVASSDFSANWTIISGTTKTTGILDPLGGSTAVTMTMTGAGALQFYQNVIVPAVNNFAVCNSIWLRRRSGVAQVQMTGGNNVMVNINPTSVWQRFSVPVTIGGNAGGTAYFLNVQEVAGTIGDALDVWAPQLELVDGQSNQAPSEYVSVGVLAAPYHGNAVDGVKYFPTTNGNSVPGANRCLHSQTFDNGTWAKQQATAVNTTAVAAPDGTLTADIYTDNGANTYHYLTQSSVAATNGQPYTLSCYVKQGTLPWIQLCVFLSGPYAFANFNLATGAVGFTSGITSSSVVALPNGWFRVSITFTAVASLTLYLESINANINSSFPTYAGTGQTMYLWGAQVEPGSVATGYNPTTTAAVPAGNVVTEAVGTLIPVATMLGYVAENAATNLCLQSQTLDTGWGVSSSVVTPNTQTSPDGTLTADTLADSAANATHHLYLIGGLTYTATTYTFSVYAKAGTLSWLQLNPQDGSTAKFANFNVSTGVVGNKGAGVTATITALPNGWYRCSLTAALNAGAGFPTFYLLNADINGGGPPYVGTGQTMYLWGAQVEQASDPSSYIPTTTVAVTRNGDALAYPQATNLDLALATTYTECYLPSAWTAELQSPLVGLLGPRQLPQFFAATTKVFGLWGAAVPQTVNARVIGAINKGASAWSGATASVCLNGGAVATGAFAPFSSVPIGISNDGPFSIRGSIRNVKFYATRLTDAELQTMTAP